MVVRVIDAVLLCAAGLACFWAAQGLGKVLNVSTDSSRGEGAFRFEAGLEGATEVVLGVITCYTLSVAAIVLAVLALLGKFSILAYLTDCLA